jgi:hypothetical protein
MKRPTAIERLEEAVSTAREELESGVASQGVGSLNKYESLLDEARQAALDSENQESESSLVMDYDFDGHMGRTEAEVAQTSLSSSGSEDSMRNFNSMAHDSGESRHQTVSGGVSSQGVFSAQPPLTVATLERGLAQDQMQDARRGLDDRSRNEERGRSR